MEELLAGQDAAKKVEEEAKKRLGLASKETDFESQVQKKLEELRMAADKAAAKAAKAAAEKAAKAAAEKLEKDLITEAVKRIVSDELDRVRKAGSLALDLFNKEKAKLVWCTTDAPAHINKIRSVADEAIKSTREAQRKLDAEKAAAAEAAKIAADAFVKRQAMVAEERAAAKKAYEEAMATGPRGFFANLKEVTINAVMREGSPPLWTQGTYYCLPTGHAWRKFNDYDRREQYPEGMVYVGLYKSTLTEAWSNVHSTGIYITGSIDERAPHPSR